MELGIRMTSGEEVEACPILEYLSSWDCLFERTPFEGVKEGSE